MRARFWLIIFGLCSLISSGFANTSRTGISLAFPVITKDPEFLHAYQITYWYQPSNLEFHNVRIYFNAAAGHWWITHTTHNHSLNIYSVSPILRYYFRIHDSISPFVNLGIGLSYLTRTHIDSQNLGEHFAFQDQLGFGTSFGKNKQLSLILSALHYSNGSLCRMNAGITVPLMVTIEYDFV